MSIRDIIVTYQSVPNALVRETPATGLESTAAVPDFAAIFRVLHQSASKVGALPATAQTAEFASRFSAALGSLEASADRPGVLTALEDETASLLQSYLAELAAAGKPLPPTPGGLEVRFDDRDILGWVGSFFSWWRGIVKHAWQNPPAQPDAFGPKLRVAVLGDWGTGLYGAPVCARSIENDPKGYQLLLHLGDVYYSGTKAEIKERFLDIWPKNGNATSRALNSNHEMYTGGHAYFGLTLERFHQTSSCFAMANAHWLLVGLDSAYADHDLAHNQADWLAGLIQAHPGRRVILFCHHQPYSLFDSQGPKLLGKLGGLLAAGKIFAWYWGHEHRCILYDTHPAWGLHGRCIGHGGYPYFRAKLHGAVRAAGSERCGFYRLPGKNLVPGGLLMDGVNAYVSGQEDRYGPNGYATLEFDQDHLVESFQDADGKEIFRQALA